MWFLILLSVMSAVSQVDIHGVCIDRSLIRNCRDIVIGDGEEQWRMEGLWWQECIIWHSQCMHWWTVGKKPPGTPYHVVDILGVHIKGLLVRNLKYQWSVMATPPQWTFTVCIDGLLVRNCIDWRSLMDWWETAWTRDLWWWHHVSGCSQCVLMDCWWETAKSRDLWWQHHNSGHSQCVLMDCLWETAKTRGLWWQHHVSGCSCCACW